MIFNHVKKLKQEEIVNELFVESFEELYVNSDLIQIDADIVPNTIGIKKLTNLIQNIDSSIITNEITIQLQKKFYPNLTQSENYNFYFNVSLNRGVLVSVRHSLILSQCLIV